jgi:hypothetical protein
MSRISERQSEIINNFGDEIIVNPCGYIEESMKHKDSFLRYFGFRKKSIIYNNSNKDVFVKIQPFAQCRIGSFTCFKYCAMDILTKNDYTVQEFYIKAGNYKKFPLPTRDFNLSIYVKYKVKYPEKVKYTEQIVPKTYIDRMLYNINGPVYITKYKTVEKEVVKWKTYCKNKTYHCSNDIFLNSASLKVLEDLPKNDLSSSG